MIRGQQDFWSGLLFVGFGAVALVIGRDYAMGTAMRMGPGYFPMILGGLVALLGCLLMLRGVLMRGESIGRTAMRPLLLVLASVALFALAVEDLGIILAVVGVVVVSSLARGRPHWGEIVLVSVVMVVLAVGLFTMGLGLPFKLWPE